MKKLLLLLLAVAIPLPAAAADLTVTYKYKGSGKGERTQYYSDNFQMTVDKGLKQDTLVDLKQDITYIIDHKSKIIQVMKMSELAGMMGGVGQMHEEMMGMKMPGKSDKTMGEAQQESITKMMGKAEDAKLEKLGPQQVAGRTCEAYRVHRKGSYIELTEEVCLDASLKPPGNLSAGQQQMAEAAKAMMGGSMGAASSPGQNELNSLPGMALKRMTKANRVQTEEEAILVKEGPIDPSLFKLPQGYQQVDQASAYQQQMQQMQQQMQGMKGQ